MKADCVTLWIGGSLGPVERACLRSVMRQGHSLAIYCYRDPTGVPEGAEVRNAEEVLPESSVLRHVSGSVALFSDWFRYELQRRNLGTWIDTDNYLISPIDMQRPYLFGKQMVDVHGRQSIAVGVLRLPPDCPMLPELIGQFDGSSVPDWIPWFAAQRAKVQRRIRGRADLSRLPWGTAGPFAITALAERHDLGQEALPAEVFNPVPWYDADWIADPTVKLEDVVTDRTVGIHLWNECIKGFKDRPAPTGSFLERLQMEGA